MDARRRPEARSYYELGATLEVFKIAEPGFLEGVKTKDKAILKMHGVGFTYPLSCSRVIWSLTREPFGSTLTCALPTWPSMPFITSRTTWT
jgi:hypothetical protein